MTLLERLKVETRPAHEQIESAIAIERRLTDHAGYRAMLARFYGFHVAWEAAAEPLIADRAFFHPRRKADLLHRDLLALGLSRADIAALPLCDPLMPMGSCAAAFGAMYVVEGSTLGGAVISRQVERALGLNAANGCAYFRSYGPAIGSMWTSFRARLLSLSGPATDDIVVTSAQRTFAVIQDWLAGTGAR